MIPNQSDTPDGAALLPRGPRRAGRRGANRLSRFALAAALLLLALGQWRCGDRHALLLTVAATDFVGSFELKVKNLETGANVLVIKDEPITTRSNPNRDISQPGQALKMSVEFPGPGHFLVYMLGDQEYVAVRDFRVDGVQERSMTLIPLEHDADGDKFPACGAFGSCEVYQNALSCAYLDCDDSEGGGSIHPFGTEVCGNGKDDDCSARCGADPAQGDAACVDADGDGAPEGPDDCDDRDPCRSKRIVEAKNLCDYRGDRKFPALPAACLEKFKEADVEPVAPYCGDGVDNDCDGQDTACEVDADCDKVPAGKDCNDADAAIRPGADELCDGIDNDCDKVTDEGCSPCDVDGDGFSAIDSDNASCPERRDADDFDAGIHPNAHSGGTEQAEGGTVLGALRRFCSDEPDKNGRAAREVDHDLDGRPAKDDGCAPAICDKDGDGFAAAGCGDPPPTPDLADCSDDADLDPNAAKIFPGAPEFCKDDVAWDCQSVRTCEGDQDDDGFLAPDDCNDSPTDPDAPNIHPWATEVCDGQDNDCDGLIDEGNPDGTGTLIATSSERCTDFSEGECAPCLDGSPSCARENRRLTGRCACSRQKPMRDAKYPLDAAKRVACSGEDDRTAVAQRCFVPAQFQPRAESCDERDHDCDGRADDPAGSNLAEVLDGRVCGTDIGTCVAGTVTGCDLSSELPNAPLLRAVLGSAINLNWRCSPGTLLPRPELCNGRDDDCNGQLPSASGGGFDETDADRDGYLACTGCRDPEVSGDYALAAGALGCGDCNDGNAAIHPNVPDECNNVDDDCNPATADGQAECSGGTPNCCSALGICVNLQADQNHCGVCGNRCSSADVDTCRGGRCVCGGRDGPCPAGLNCEGGQCVCKTRASGGRCDGCCDGNSCVFFTAQSTGVCGREGASCQSCNDGLSCTDDSCNSGSCQNARRSVGASCDGGAGRCSSDNPVQCCSGCLDGGGRCRGGTSLGECGRAGASCGVCAAAECKLASCSNGTCNANAANAPDNTTRCDKDSFGCTDEVCRAGSCVQDVTTGCLIGASCVAEGTLRGTSGDDSCRRCTSSSNNRDWTALDGVDCAGDGRSCTRDVCRAGSCQHEQLAETCLIGGTCYARGDSNPADRCQSCDPDRSVTSWSSRSCSDGLSCTTDRCVAGSCDYSQIAGGTCSIAGACYAVGDAKPGDPCFACTSASQSSWSPRPGVSCSSGGDAGRCDKDGSCCTGCLSGSDTCHPGDTDDRCGEDGQACSDCTAFTPDRECTAGSCT